MAKLTDKQELFCREYLKDLNGKQAAIRAGYSEKTAEFQASRLLSNDKVQTRITELKSKRNERIDIDSDYMTKTLLNWLNADITQTLSLTAEEIKKLPIEVRKMVSSYKRNTTKVNDEVTKETFDLKFVSKEKAAEMLSKHIGYFEKDNERNITLNDNAISNLPVETQLSILKQIQDAKQTK